MRNKAIRSGLPLVVLVLLLILGAVFYSQNGHLARAMDTCVASITWDKHTISKGGSATESWVITGADQASGGCTDGDTINTFHDKTLGFGPQSYTFKNVQKPIVCTVTGYVDGKQGCTGSDALVIAPPPPPAASGAERCWFDKPGQLGYLFGAQDSNYTATVNADICWSVQSGNDKIDICAGDLHWTAVSGPSYYAPALNNSDYTAILNGGSYQNKILKASDGVRLTRSELLQNNTYSVNIKNKTGSTVTSCSVKISASVPAGPSQIPIAPGKFPGAGDYPVPTSKGPVSVDFKYAPQIPGVFTPVQGAFGALNPTWKSGDSVGFFLGQFQKAIYYVIGHEPGAYGSWDLSDPFSPSGPSLQFLSSDNGGGGPIQHLWPHASHGIGAAVGESEDGTARMMNKNGLAEFYGDSYICGSDPVYGYPLVCHATYGNAPTSISVQSFSSGGKASFGQQIEVYDTTVPLAVLVTPEGNFFGYSAQGNKINVFDVSGPSESADPPYLKPSATISWTDVTDMQITHIPGSASQYIIARSGSGQSFRVGELSSETGKIKRQKTVNLAIKGAAFTNLRTVTIQNSTYIFAVEKVEPSFKSNNYNVPSIGSITIGAYKFNPGELSVSRKGGVTIKSAGIDGIGINGYFEIIASDSNSSYPFLAAPSYKKVGDSVVDNGIDMYSLQNFLTAGGDITPGPTFNLPAVTQWPVPVGGIIVNQWPLNGFLKTENSKINLYLYRGAFYYGGKSDTSYGISYSRVEERGPATIPFFTWGNPTVRVDKMDVTGLTGSYTPPNDGGGIPPPGGGGGDTPPLGSGVCYAKYPNNTQLRVLCEQIEALKRQVCAISPSLPLCSSL